MAESSYPKRQKMEMESEKSSPLKNVNVGKAAIAIDMILNIDFEDFKSIVGNMDIDSYTQLSKRLSGIGQAMKESRACFTDIPVIAVASNMFPFLENRTDWNNFALVSKEIHKAVTEHKDLSPPWPECQLNDASIDDYSIPKFSHDGEFIAYGNHEGCIFIWSRRKGLVASWRRVHGGDSSVSFSPCSNVLVSTGRDKKIKLWDLDNHNRCCWTQQVVELHDKIAFSPIGDVFATFGRSNETAVCLRNTLDGSLSKTVTSSIDRKCRVAISPDGRMLAVGGCSNAIELCYLGDSSESTATILNGHTRRQRRPTGYVVDIAYSPDGKFLASASSTDKTIKIWDMASQQCIQSLTGHTRQVISISYSPDGKFLASSSVDSDIRLWSIANGNCVEIIEADRIVHLVEFSPDGKILLTTENLEVNRISRLRYVNPA
jgi:WD40 repeat protein